ncbi:disease resistance protein RPV1-like [Prosopis cineraria]|uniref:disease resistance protein RPV1-like n=1 Tax=Prosopis cineraria TaxID=364024 RepID=UPI00240FE659|nr:disease resistance protein RPV1-like [Prosopis cineraria]
MASSSPSSKKYDVFVSFRGEDTRDNFTSHLHAALCGSKIDTYVDYRLEKGSEVWPSLVQAIDDSILFLVIFSENYASSTWCLNEIAKIILDYSKDQEHRVLPVFYRVNPSHVRKQTGSYGEAFIKHEQGNHSQQVQKWRSALTQAANLSGWDFSTYRNEAELIVDIVICVLKKLERIHQIDAFVGLVGIHERIVPVELLLSKESQDVRFIGIWGMAGIGKTTIADAVFKKHCCDYEGFCFLANVREESKKWGIAYLKSKLLFKLLEDQEPYIGMPDRGTPLDMKRLKRKKVFVVLDDVSDSDQLEILAGARDWFGPGSRIIITSRDKNVLGKEVRHVHVVKALNFGEALQLFNLNAFKNNVIDKEFALLSRKVVLYAKGLPLALKILGSFLYGKSKSEWESQLEKLKRLPDMKIQNVLKLSYDGLDFQERNIFLDIACFFKGRKVEDIKNLLDACDYATTIGLRTLEDKALLTILDEKVSMHDLIQEMAWEIVREESMEEPGKRSRLWDFNDVYEVLKYNVGTESIKGIALDLSKIDDLPLSPEVFSKMRKLKFLIFYNFGSEEFRMYLPQDLRCLPNELRLLHWDNFPLKSLPPTFSAEKLVSFEMRNSQVRILWHGKQNLVNLRKIDLTDCYNLIELPDFSKASNLKQVYLSKCTSLRDLHPSILSLHKLEILALDWCEALTSLRSDTPLRSLRDLSLYDCSRLKVFSVTSHNMRHLNLAGTAVSELPSSITSQGRLETFSLIDGRSLDTPSKSGDLISLGELHTGDNYMHLDASNLRFLYDGLRSLEALPRETSMFSSLEVLLIVGTELRNLPASIKHLLRLRYIRFDSCKRLQSLPDLPSSLEQLIAIDCPSLETLNFSSTTSQLLKANKISFDFQNCAKLDEHSFKLFGSNVMAEIIKSVPAIEKCSFSNGKVEVIYPGSRVPEWFLHKTTQASVTIDLSSALDCSENWGFIFCIIVPEAPSIEWIRIECGACLEISRGEWEETHEFYSLSAKHVNFSSDHVFLYYDENFCSEIHETLKESVGDVQNNVRKPKVSFNFWVHFGGGDIHEKQEGCLDIIGCGVCSTYASEYRDFIEKMNLQLQSKTDAIEMGHGSSHENEQKQKSEEGVVFPYLARGTWKHGTKGLKDFFA